MSPTVKVTIVGAGNMGGAMGRALAREGRWSVSMIDRPGATVSPIENVRVETDLGVACKGSGVVIVAVKPQDAEAVLASLRGIVPAKAVLVSIMAGVPMASLRRTSRVARLVRAMPNMPAQIGQGMTAWFPSRSLDQKDFDMLSALFGAFGRETRVKNERLIDAATAVSGSGPAYVFALAEYLARAAETLGFSKDAATAMAKQTILGSAMLMDESAETPATLRERVTSKKGTTEAALKVFERRKAGAMYQSAIEAAFARAQELSKRSD